MSLGDKFWQSETTVIAAGQNPAGRLNCAIFRRKVRQGVMELVGQFVQFSKGELGRSSSWDLCNFSGEDNVGSGRHWQKNLHSFLEEHKVGLEMLLIKTVQS